MTIRSDAVKPLVHEYEFSLAEPEKIANGNRDFVNRSEFTAAVDVRCEISHPADDQHPTRIDKLEPAGLALFGGDLACLSESSRIKAMRVKRSVVVPVRDQRFTR